MSSRKQEAAGWAMTFGQFDDGLATWYSVDLDATPNHAQHDDIERTGVRFETGSAGIGQKVQSVRVRFRKHGSNWGC